MQRELLCCSPLRWPDSPEPLAQLRHRWESLSQEQGPIRRHREGVAGQVGPGGRGGGPPAVGELQDEPRGILPPEVVHHGGEGTADGMAALLKDTDPHPPNVE